MGPSVDVLRCPRCGADVPLGAADEARCVHCGAGVPLPEAHRQLQALQREDDATRSRAHALFASLDSPPWLVTRVIAAVFDQPMFVFWIFFGVPVGLASIFAGLVVGDRAGSTLLLTAATFGSLFVLTFLPRSFGIYANRRTGARRVLLGGLQARPPKSPGGPASCRECGAPLDVHEGALVARCAYCGADNAVRVRTPFLDRTRRAVRTAAHTIDEAAALDQRERAETRGVFLRELLRYGMIIGVFAALFGTFMWDDARAQARGDDSAPALGITALVLGTFLLIGLFFWSGGRSDRDAEEARQRREGNALPSWVRVVGPPGVWVVLLVVRWLVFR
jgi:DNA-directed RNA polymerase subunit RPC12/RpoP